MDGTSSSSADRCARSLKFRRVPFVDMVIDVLVVLQREVPMIQKVQKLIEVFQKTSSGQEC